MPILLAENFPEHIVTWKDNYAEMDTKAYNPIYKGRFKKIQGCFVMGFNVERNWCVERAADDLKLLGAKFMVKPVQQLRTDSTMTFLGILITADPSTVKELVNDMLKPLKLKLMKDNPTHFPTFRYGRSDWVEYSMTKSMPFGMSFEKYKI